MTRQKWCIVQQNVDVVTYEAGNEEDRKDKLNSLDNVKFSLSTDDLTSMLANKPGVVYNNGRQINLRKDIAARAKSNINTEYYYRNKKHDGLQLADVVTSDSEHYVVVYEDFGFDNYRFIGMFSANNAVADKVKGALNNEGFTLRFNNSFSGVRDFRNRNIGSSFGNRQRRANNGVRRQAISGRGKRLRDVRWNSNESADGNDPRSIHAQFWKEFDEEYGYLVDGELAKKGHKLSIPTA